MCEGSPPKARESQTISSLDWSSITKQSLPDIIPAAWKQFGGGDLHLVHMSGEVVGKMVGHHHPLRHRAQASRHHLRRGRQGGRALQERKNGQQVLYELVHHLLCALVTVAGRIQQHYGLE